MITSSRPQGGILRDQLFSQDVCRVGTTQVELHGYRSGKTDRPRARLVAEVCTGQGTADLRFHSHEHRQTQNQRTCRYKKRGEREKGGK